MCEWIHRKPDNSNNMEQATRARWQLRAQIGGKMSKLPTFCCSCASTRYHSRMVTHQVPLCFPHCLSKSRDYWWSFIWFIGHHGFSARIPVIVSRKFSQWTVDLLNNNFLSQPCEKCGLQIYTPMVIMNIQTFHKDASCPRTGSVSYYQIAQEYNNV